ncbi:hypothetical protein [Caballeronia glathei]|uniref:hypothetical protein n=1 Tax=Caballeronia glathei TaxID=60547 RepID=UPI00101A9F7F|nr:hypothetical protein [Caballeronia glathei]
MKTADLMEMKKTVSAYGRGHFRLPLKEWVRVNVRVRRPLSGDAGVTIVPGTYTVDHRGNDLRFIDPSDPEGRIYVDLRDHPESGTFPDDVAPDSPIEIVRSGDD